MIKWRETVSEYAFHTLMAGRATSTQDLGDRTVYYNNNNDAIGMTEDGEFHIYYDEEE
jgi:hypothetical protein